jgi:hypothetical protein
MMWFLVMFFFCHPKMKDLQVMKKMCKKKVPIPGLEQNTRWYRGPERALSNPYLIYAWNPCTILVWGFQAIDANNILLCHPTGCKFDP